MDQFDLLNDAASQPSATNIQQDDDLFGSVSTEQVPVNTSSNIQQDDDLFGSINTEQVSVNTSSDNQQFDFASDIGNDSNKTDILGDDNFNSPQQQETSLFDNDNFTSAPQEQQQQETSLFDNDTLDDVSTATFNDDTLTSLNSAPTQTASSFDNDMFTNQSNTNDFSPPADNTLYNDTSKQSGDNTTTSYDMFAQPAASQNVTENLSPLEAFNKRRQEEIAGKDAEEKRKIDALRQEAKQDLDRWYQDRQKRMEQKRQEIKQDEDTLRAQALQKSDKQTCDWPKVVRFLEFAQGTQLSKGKRDLNRMKACILHAKRDKDSPRQSENGV